ncbi:MAG: ABC transporter permease [Dehalococcoidia bacterium]|nr:ABC transporter permease [Dehalococcoidia bacterium]
MSLLQLAYIIAWRRIVSSWKLELALFLGITMAVALLASGAVFSDLLAEAALRRALQEAKPEEANFLVRVFNDLDDPSVVSPATSIYQRNNRFVDGRVFTPLRPYLKGHREQLLETATFFFEGHPQLAGPDQARPRGKFQYLRGLQQPGRAELLQGSWPRQGAIGQEEPLEVALDDVGAGLLQLGVGQEMWVYPASGATERAQARVKVKIAGVFHRVAPSDEFWYSTQGAFSYRDDRWTIVPLFTAEATILGPVARAYPGLYTNVTWVFYLDRNGVRAGDVASLQQTLLQVEHDVRAGLQRSSYSLLLNRVLEAYEEQLLLARIPLFLMLCLVTGILVYYLTLVAGLVVRSRSSEIAMLKSRGCTTRQVGLMVLVEALVLAVPALALGVPLALGAAQILGSLFFNQGGGVATASISLSLRPLLLGGGGALLAVVVLTASSLVAARRSIVEYHQNSARPPTNTFFHRYYLDLMSLALIGLLWWQVRTRGSFLVRPLGSGELELDLTLMLGPVLGLLAVSLLVLRILPVGWALLARVAEPLGQAWLTHGLKRLSRDPIPPGSLVVLLMLATALGVIGSTFSATLARSQHDRARYAAGADVRIQHDGDQTVRPPLARAGELVPSGVAAEVQRASGHLLTRGFSSAQVSVLAVDTSNFDQVAWYRPDFAGGTALPELMAAITPNSPAAGSSEAIAGGVKLPPEARGLALWANPGRPDSRLSVQARLRDARGYYFDVRIGEMTSRGWQRLESSLTPVAPAGVRPQGGVAALVPAPPFTLQGLQVTSAFGINEPGVVFFGTLSALIPAGERVLADFQTLDGWQAVEDYSRPGLYALEASESVALPNQARSAAYSWSPGGIGFRGIEAGLPEAPIPALVSRNLLQAAQASPGDTLRLSLSTYALPIQVVAVADYFPTLDPRQEPFVVLDLDTFQTYSNRHSRRLVGGANELWGQRDDAETGLASTTQALGSHGLRVREVSLASELEAKRVDQPLVNAGWGGLLVLMFLTLVLASASGVVLFCYLDTRERRVEFALLRTLGASQVQVNGVVWFNLALVAACGIGFGTAAGLQIGASLLPLLEVAEGGVRVTPPMVLQADWGNLTLAYLLLAGVVVGTAGWLARLTAKLEVHRLLRAGDA